MHMKASGPTYVHTYTHIIVTGGKTAHTGVELHNVGMYAHNYVHVRV